MSTPVRHHQVPVLYLRRFAVEGMVEIRVRGSATSRSASVRDVAVQRHFYSYVDSSGQHVVDVEKYLAEEVEAPAAPSLQAYTRGDAGPNERDALLRFIAFQIVRSPRFRAVDAQLWASLGPILAGVDAASAAAREGSDKLRWREAFDDARANPADEYQPTADANSAIRTMIRYVERVEEAMQQLRLVVAFTQEPTLLTSDSPVVFFRPAVDSDGFHGFVPDEASELRFPLDPSHLLLGTFERSAIGPERFEAPRGLVLQANAQQRRECQNAVFHQPGTEPAGGTEMAAHAPPLPEPTITLAPGTGTTTDTTLPVPADPRLAAFIDEAAAPTNRPSR